MSNIVEQTAEVFAAIDAANPTLNCVVESDRESALDAARAAHHRRVRAQSLGPLDGVAVVVKDNLDVEGMRTRHGSALFGSTTAAERDAAAVSGLRAAGAIITAKSHMTELACGTDGRNPHFGDARNPRNIDHHAGGSSSGSAASVAAGLVPLAIGSDTGGSIRIPAAACGIVGLKPSRGRISNVGMSVGATALDHIGPLAATVQTAAVGLAAMQSDGHDDPTALLDGSVDMRAGILLGDFVQRCEASVLATFESALETLERLGVELTELDLGIDLAAADEQANLLGRDLFDAVGDKIRAADSGTIGPELTMWVDLYDTVTDSQYDTAMSTMRELTDRVHATMRAEHLDVLVCPTMRIGAGLLATVGDEPRHDRCGNLSLFNLTGQPSLTIPCGVDRNAMPTGLLITGHHGRDDQVLQLGAAFERDHADWTPGGGWTPTDTVTSVSL